MTVSLLLLDTTSLIDPERSDRDLDALIDDQDDVAVAAITVAELSVGVALASDRARSRRQTYVDAIVASVVVLPHDMTVALVHVELLAGCDVRDFRAAPTTGSSRPLHAPEVASSSAPIDGRSTTSPGSRRSTNVDL